MFDIKPMVMPDQIPRPDHDFSLRFIEVFPPKVLAMLKHNCTTTVDEQGKIDFVVGNFYLPKTQERLLFEMCIDIDPKGKVRVYDLNPPGGESERMRIDEFIEKIDGAQNIGFTTINLDEEEA